MSQLKVSSASETCAWCAGKGTQARSGGFFVSCLVCGGKGKVSVAQPAGACRQCNGTGRRNADRPCLTCAGTGWGREFALG
ncbi:MAG: transcriptional regulator [Pyrinomonadaceae bacterium]|nr:transcriptional regulator [Pyrinomonadaceae bacterium]